MIKIFPEKSYKVELSIDSKIAMDNLKNETEIKDLLISEWTKKSFIGQVFENDFRLISSKVGRGAICVLKGQFKISIEQLKLKFMMLLKSCSQF